MIVDIMEENQHHLDIACEASKGNFVVLWTQFLNFFETA